MRVKKIPAQRTVCIIHILRYNANMSVQNLSPKTTFLYNRWLKKFQSQYPASTQPEALGFLSEVKQSEKIQSYIQARAALNHWFNKIKGEPFNPPAVNHTVKTRLLELNIPSDKVLEQIIERVENKKYQLVFWLSYKMGIRFFDILHLKIDDVDFENGLLPKIKRGLRDIPPELLADLRLFAQEAQTLSSQYLFRLQIYPYNNHINSNLIRTVMLQAAHELGITPPDTSAFFIAAIRRFFREGHTLAEGRKIFGYKLLGSTEALKKLYLEAKKHCD